MAAAARLYNPFRDEQKAKEQQDTSFNASFNFSIQPSEFASFEEQEEREKNDPNLPDFDPFGVVAAASVGQEIKTVGSNVSNSSKSVPRALTPKLVVKLSTHEEVTSRVKMALDEFDVTSEITVEGTVYAQVQCSDAKKNAPFALLMPLTASQDSSFSIRPNEQYAVTRNATPTTTNAAKVPLLVTIPKQDIVAVPIAYYSVQKKEVKFMPVLVERKVTRNGTRVRIAIQVRSRLDNRGDMKDLTILVAVPEKVNGSTVTIVRGSGVWDGLQRTIKFKVAQLFKGQSELVTAEANLWNPPAFGGGGQDETPFPVMFRCTSMADAILPLEWKVAQVSGSPAQITVPCVPHNNTFRLLHRLP